MALTSLYFPSKISLHLLHDPRAQRDGRNSPYCSYNIFLITIPAWKYVDSISAREKKSGALANLDFKGIRCSQKQIGFLGNIHSMCRANYKYSQLYPVNGWITWSMETEALSSHLSKRVKSGKNLLKKANVLTFLELKNRWGSLIKVLQESRYHTSKKKKENPLGDNTVCVN